MARVHTFAGNPLDRGGNQRRDPLWLTAQRDKATSRFLPLRELKALMRVRDGLAIGWCSRAEVEPQIQAGAMVVFLGLDREGIAHFAIDASMPAGERGDAPFPNARDCKYIDVRTAASQCAGPEAGILAQSRSLIDWHARHRFCAVCGAPTEAREGGYMRQCVNADCKASHFPRTDPVAIMLVIDGENALLGRQARFLPNVYSALAGFVEPGESIEEAVRREVLEEAGIQVGEVHYHSSQPWPFPSSLMIGCLAEAASRDIRVDPQELEEARWFSRAEVAAMVESWSSDQALRMPPPLAIAHQLARGWLNGE